MKLEIYNPYTMEFIHVKLKPETRRITYYSHPNNTWKDRLGDRPLSVAQLFRMKVGPLNTFLESLTPAERKKLVDLIQRSAKKRELSIDLVKKADRLLA